MDYANAIELLWRASDEVKRAGEVCPIPSESLHLNTRDGADYDLAAGDFIVHSEEEWQRATVTWRQVEELQRAYDGLPAFFYARRLAEIEEYADIEEIIARSEE